MSKEQLEEWVQDILLDYAAKGYSQEDVRQLGGHFAHHPIPKWKEGVDGIFLFEEDHAVHGVLQSEVFQHPCIYGWEGKYLKGELLEKFQYWLSYKSRYAGTFVDYSKISASTKKQHKEKLPDGRSAFAVYMSSKVDQEKAGKAGAESTHKDRDELGRSLHAMNTLVPYSKENGRRVGSDKWMSLVDGHISNAGGVATHNRGEGKDPNAKVRLTPEEAAFIFLWA